MKNILIAGDSWGCGEWDYLNETRTDDYGVSHKGLEQYLIDEGHQVKNISIPAGSNRQSIEALRKELLVNSYDYVFWFQTDPIRTYFRGSEEDKIKLTNTWYTVDDLLHHQNISLDEAYASLSEIPNTVYCLGGFSKIDAQKMSEYSNLVCFIPSVVELCVPSKKHPIITFSDWIDYIPKHFEDFDRLIKIKYQSDEWYEDPLLKEYFYPDGNHANRMGHLKIFEYIIEYFKFDKNI